MAKRRAKRDRRPRGGRRNATRWAQAFLGIFPYVISFGLVGGLIGGSYAFAVQSDLFALQDVVIENALKTPAAERFRFAGLRPGQWLLTTDLEAVETYIRRYHPEYQEVTVRRVLPGEIRIAIRQRIPVAAVNLSRRVLIDHEGYVLPDTTGRRKSYPVITGVPASQKSVQAGSRIHYRPLERAVLLIQDIEKKRVFREHRLEEVNVTDRRNFILKAAGGIEIRMGSRNFGEKLDKLSEAVAEMDLDPKKIRYIDLRFDDIVIGPR